ncbi:MAG TPA: Mur ligase family protein, partial [Longimicrobiales bacterium]|nr:Mur ligase family protein [Longimicrobiales bacterium]
MSPAGSRSLDSPHRLDVPGSDPLAVRLFPPLPREAEWELSRVERLLSEAGDPQLDYPSLHVGGTNGKGSVAALLSSVLRRRGLRVGLYTSPHLVRFRERYAVDGRPAAEDELLEAAASLRGGIVSHGLTFFEAATVLAFELFRREGVEAAVVEVGLGGRLDATNVLRPEVAAVTNVALDHAEYLGADLSAIAREKAAIAKPGVPFVTTETDPRVLEVLRSVAEERGAEFHAVDPARELEGVETGPDGTAFEVGTGAWGRVRVRVPLAGRHQAV